VLFEQPFEQGVESIESAGGPDRHVGRFMVFQHQPPGEIGESDAQRRGPERTHKNVPSGRGEADLARRASAGRSPEIALLHESARDEGGDPIDDHGPAQSGQPLDFLASLGPARSDQAKDEGEAIGFGSHLPPPKPSGRAGPASPAAHATCQDGNPPFSN
jgi:hypothetical protein